MQERTCSKCGVSKPETNEFFRKRGTKDRGGLRPDCRECCNARDRRHYAENPDYYRAYRQANAEVLAAYQAEYWKTYYSTTNGRAAVRRAVAKWYASPHGKASRVRARQRRRAKLAQVESNFSPEDWSACRSFFGNRCAYCGEEKALTQDHVIPLELGGPYVPGNIVPACLSCNSSKHVRVVEEWFPAQPHFSKDRMMMIIGYLAEVA